MNEKSSRYNALLFRQQKLNISLAEILKRNGIKQLNLISLGNSIASGYSARRKIEPLLFRNKSLESIMGIYNIATETYHFARAQNNNDHHIYSWLINNKRLNDIFECNRKDYLASAITMLNRGITPEKVDEYYPKDIASEIKINDTIFNQDKTHANIVVYNGGTGSFLDIITRGGNILDCYTEGVMRDIKGIEATLMYIQIHNRENNTNTQVYICGAPNILGLKVTELINHHLKKLAKKYANVVYVEPVATKFLYQPLTQDKEQAKKQQNQLLNKIPLLPDYHYDEEEYMKLNNNIIQAIIENYQTTSVMIDIDRAFYRISSGLEINCQMFINDARILELVIETQINMFSSKIKSNKEREKLYTKLKKYLLKITPYDFYYLGRRNIRRVLKRKSVTEQK